MPASLLIVESPAKCSKIQGFLGAGWKVIATMGHIRALEEDLEAIGLNNDFNPLYTFLKEKGKAIANIKEEAAKADRVYLASDDDREGEAISYSVAVLLKLDPATTPRAVFREITATAVKAAVASPRRIDMNRVNAQQARAVLDMMVGFTISPLLWKYVGQGLSAGRCQTPALRLLVDRENDIRNFTKETSWRLKGTWTTGLTTFEATLEEDLEDEESAKNFLENIHNDWLGEVASSTLKPTMESPPLPLITSTLQQEVSATLGIQPKNTMRIAQRLYEAGHITYMRTDCAVLSIEAREAAEAWVRSHFGDAFCRGEGAPAPGGLKTPAKKKSEQQTTQAQEAHEAIRPTHFEVEDLPADEDWNGSDRKIYRLVWQRAVQSVMAAAKGEQLIVKLKANGDPNEFLWSAVWKRQLFAGWRRIGAAATDLDAEDEEVKSGTATAMTGWTAATQLKTGTEVEWAALQAAPYESRAPARYTEATLIRELEKRGIGRPSTFAQLVGTILEKTYAEKKDTPAREVKETHLKLEEHNQWPPLEVPVTKKVGAEKQKLLPTALGKSVLEFCLREFDALFAYEFTAQMEGRLDKIADGEEAWKALCRDTWNSYKEKYEGLKEGAGAAAGGQASARERVFAGGIKAVQSKKGPLLLKEGTGTTAAKKKETAVFYGWPAHNPSFQKITEEEVAEFVRSKVEGTAGTQIGEYEGEPILKKSGPYGAYAECKGVKVPWTAEDTEATLAEKLAAKSSAVLHRLGPFEFRRGPYGVYFFKVDQLGKARKFVGLPSGVDPKTLTQEAAVKLYQDGLKTKAKAGSYAAAKGAATSTEKPKAPYKKKWGSK